MATGTVVFPLLGGIQDDTAPPGIGYAGDRAYLTFDSGTDELITWTFRMPADYASAPVAKVIWSGSSSTTTSHSAVWSVEVMAMTPDTDSVAIDTDSFDTANTVTDDILGTTAKRPQLASITLTNADSVAAGDYVAVRLSRDADNVSDDLSEDAWLWAFALEYTTS